MSNPNKIAIVNGVTISESRISQSSYCTSLIDCESIGHKTFRLERLKFLFALYRQ